MNTNPGGVSQVFCPNCRGGNPPAATFCMWCQAPLAARTPLPPPGVPSYPPAYPMAAQRPSRGLQGSLLASSILLFLAGTILGSFEGTIRNGQIIARRYYFGDTLAALGTLLLLLGVGVFNMFLGVALLQGREPPRMLIGLGIFIFLTGLFVGLSDLVTVGRESAPFIQGSGLGIVGLYFVLLLIRRN
ncbi:MAG: hypothetical protein M3Z04_12870 [Chloroflexota bacterium]|nr:hypothetical protein [Chloroflexota bacterium]